MSEKSPYREVGLDAQYVSRQPAKSRPVGKKPYAHDPKKLPRFGHDFAPLSAASPSGAGADTVRANTAPCRRCHKPRFAVDGQKCKGKP